MYSYIKDNDENNKIKEDTEDLRMVIIGDKIKQIIERLILYSISFRIYLKVDSNLINNSII